MENDLRRWMTLVEMHKLHESWLMSIDDGYGHDYDVFQNPSRAEAFKLIATDEYKQARGILTPTDLYICGSGLTHFDLAQALKLDRDATARIFLDRNGPYLNIDDEMAQIDDPSVDKDDIDPWTTAQRKLVDDLAADHPSLKRIYGRYTVGIR
jgi:hypothetical protein